MPNQEPEIIDTSEQEDEDLSAPLRYSISSYGADYPIDSLVQRMNSNDIYIPEFQRSFVWTWPQASRFIESLLLGLPVPGIFLFRETSTQRLVVIDGHQRLHSLRSFYNGIIRNSMFRLKGVDEQFQGLTYKDLGGDDRRILDNSILHATIFQQDEPTGDKSSIYKVFERLNTGGTPLSDQELRACLCIGPFDRLLKELNQDPNWRGIYGRVSDRGRDQELILRFFALKENWEKYYRPLKQFLNDYMDSNSNASDEWISRHREMFCDTIQVASKHLTKESFRRTRSLNVAVTDAMLVGLSFRLDHGPISAPEGLRSIAVKLRDSESFLEVTDQRTAEPASIHSRIQQAINAFSEVP